MIRQNIIIYEEPEKKPEKDTPHPSAKPTPSPQGEGKAKRTTRKKVEE